VADIYDHDRAFDDALRTLAGNNFNYRQFGSLTVKEAIKVASAIRQIKAAPAVAAQRSVLRRPVVGKLDLVMTV
jgi:hypothetical protein